MLPRILLVTLALGSCTRAEPPASTAGNPVGADTKPDDGTPPAVTAQPFARDDKDAVKAALRANGYDVHEDMCFEWPSSFPRVVVIGGFAHDRGCDHDGMFVDQQFFASGGDVEALATRGFAEAGIAEKEAIALAYVDEVAHAFGGGFVRASTPAFELEGSPKFEPVHARANKVGGVVVEGWVQDPAGMRDESSYRFVTLRFAPDGSMSGESKRQFTVDGERLRAPTPGG